jgi:hypothetical protein
MTMLTSYANNLFATRSTLTEALTQANDLYGAAMSTADSIAMRTAVYVVLNTAIQEHVRELDAIYDKHAAEVQDLRSRMAARPDPVTALLALVDERVTAVLDERMDSVFADKFDDAVDSWADDNLSSKMDDWYGDNVDITDDVKKVVEDEIDLDDLVQEKVTAFFGSNTFSIEPR